MYLFTVAVAVIAVARVSELPLPVAEGPLEPEVVELTEAGDVLRRWPIPVDLIVAGVGKEQIDWNRPPPVS